MLIKDVNVFTSVEEKGADGIIKHVEDELSKFYNIQDMVPGVAYITGHLKKAILLEDLLTIDVPFCKYYLNELSVSNLF